jgi:hypothetical protein
MISLAETNSYEQFKLDNQSLIETNPEIKRKPYFHDEVEDEVEEE